MVCANGCIFDENIRRTQYNFERELRSAKIIMLSFVAIVASTFFVVASSAFLSDGVREINFTKIHDESDEYDFEYELECGNTFRGRTFIVNVPDEHIYVMFGADDILYWVQFTEDEYKNKTYLTKTVRLIERSENKLKFKDDFIDYDLTILKGFLFVAPYQTSWDLEQICFTKTDSKNQTFNYIISATNNSRRYNGTTFYESNDPYVQRIHLDDGTQRNDTYEMNFTDDEINSNDTFCK
ncbi:uncharacterized protein LOC129568316 [Sitodiplosis mosellana]|uniref:uncharacterized protein LOC129568316 n=1 Tax=Sitodiplosis mosellana TaxID=263140 RepID=UPI002444F529|nr:uncharacterized protein LOC129568316 [Sitodiplosis mosellana]